MKKKLFGPWPKNVQTYSWWKLGVLSTPYDLPKNLCMPWSPGGRYLPPALSLDKGQ